MTATMAGAAAGAISACVVSQMRQPPPAPAATGDGPRVSESEPRCATKYTGVANEARSKAMGEGGKWTKPVVVSPSPALEGLARTIRKRLGCEEFSDTQGPTVDLNRFKSNDPDIKFNWERVVGRKVIFIFDTVDQSQFFQQLALLQALQGFAVPDGGDKSTKWKTYVDQGKYSWGRASEITVVIPWYRPCQMERTSRWGFQEDGKWTNADQNGKWLDVPGALYYARLLCALGSVPPLPGPSMALDNMPLHPLWRPPVELLFVELHEEMPVKTAVSDLGATIRCERFVPYFLNNFKGKKTYPGKASMYILFPDRGAYDRYSHAVRDVMALDTDHIIFIKKSRVGDQITQTQKLFYDLGEGQDDGEKTAFKATDTILIVDDFTQSGSTLFGAVGLIKTMTEGDVTPNVSIFVSHIVATYDTDVVNSLKQKLHALGPTCKLFCTNSIPLTTNLLKDDPQVEVVDISDFIADMVQ